MSTYIRYSAPGAISLGDVETTAATTLYVATTGNDSNPGTQALPFLTIQAALNALPKRLTLANPATISVGAGSFAGAVINGFYIELGSWLQLVGTMTAATVTGLQTGTLASATAGSNTSGTWATATVTGAGWTVDALRGKFIKITGGTGSGQLRPISSNTATVITIPGAWSTTPNATSTFDIVEQATIINVDANRPAHLDSSSAAFAGFVIYNNVSQNSNASFGSIYIDAFKMATSTRSYQIQNSQVLVRNNWFNQSGSNTIINLGNRFGDSGRLALMDSFIDANSTYTLNTLGTVGAYLLRNVQTAGGLVQGNLNGTNLASGATVWVSSNSLINYSAEAIVGQALFVQSEGNKFNPGTAGAAKMGIRLGSQASPAIGGGFSYFTSSADDFSNCGVAVYAAGMVQGTLLTATGTSNTTAVKVENGAAVQISSTTTLTGTTEISVDGTASTLAALRAATPKVLSNPNYGTKVYE